MKILTFLLLIFTNLTFSQVTFPVSSDQEGSFDIYACETSGGGGNFTFAIVNHGVAGYSYGYVFKGLTYPWEKDAEKLYYGSISKTQINGHDYRNHIDIVSQKRIEFSITDFSKGEGRFMIGIATERALIGDCLIIKN